MSRVGGLLRFIELPLLKRELTELAQRPRTYWVRVGAAIVLISAILISFANSLTEWQQINRMNAGLNPNIWLGIGGFLFNRTMPHLFTAVGLLMPAFCCSAFTAEKERNTLGNLFLTQLSPSRLIAEKLFSRMIPMLTILMLAMPMLAFVYSMGGVDTSILVITPWLLFCECLLYAAVAMFFSVWCTGTVSAFISSYVVVGILKFFGLVTRLPVTPADLWSFANRGSSLISVRQAAGFVPPGGGRTLLQAIALFFATIPCLMMIAGILIACRFLLFPRAFVKQQSVIMQVFRRIDGFFRQLNEATTGGIELVKDAAAYPEFDPVSWRERTKKSLGTARYLFRILTAMLTPTLFVCGWAAVDSATNDFRGLTTLLTLLWVLSALILMVKSATLITSERSRETLEALISTPMSGTSILQQKINGTTRLLVVLAVPVMTVVFTQSLLLNGSVISRVGYFLASAFLTAVLLKEISWISAAIGFRIHGQMKAVLTCMGVLVLIVGVPLILAETLERVGQGARNVPAQVIRGLSPGGPFVLSQEIADLSGSYGGTYGYVSASRSGRYQGAGDRMLALGLSLLFHGGIILLLKRHTLSRSDRILQRNETHRSPSEELYSLPASQPSEAIA